MKNLLVFVLCTCFAIGMQAQNQKVKQKVQLKDGTEIIGYVAPQADGSYVIQNEAGDMFFYTGAEIKKIVEIEEAKVKTIEKKDKSVNSKEPVSATSGKEYKKKGYMGIVSGHIGSALSVSIINGYRFSPHFYLGIETGVGFDILLETPQVPSINLYLMSEFSKKRVAMFADLSGGIYYDIWEGAVNPQAALTLGVRNRFRKNPNHAMWWGLNFGIRGWEYYFEGEYQGGFGPTICAKIAFSF